MRVPRYQERRVVPIRAPVVRAEERTAALVPQAVSRLAGVVGQIAGLIDQRADELKRQKENNYISEQTNAFDRLLLAKHQEETTQVGKPAIGGTGRIQAYSVEQQRAFLDNAPRHLQEVLRQRLSTRSLAYERSISRHEATQLQVVDQIYVAEAKETAMRKAYDMVNDDVSLDEIGLQTAEFAGAARAEFELRGTPWTFQDRSDIYGSPVQAMIDKYPYRAEEVLRTVESEMTTEDIVAREKGIRIAVRAANAEKRRIDDKVKADEKEAIEKAREEFRQTVIVPGIVNGTLTNPQIAGGPLGGKEENQLIGQNNRRQRRRAKALAAGKKDPYEITDPKVYGTVSYSINNDPVSIESADRIWASHGKGLSTDDCQKFQKLWEQKIKDPKPEKDARQTKLNRSIERDRTANVFDPSDPVMNDILAGEAMNRIDRAFEENPGMTNNDAKVLYEDITEKPKSDWAGWLLDNVIVPLKTAVELPIAAEVRKLIPLKTKRQRAIDMLNARRLATDEDSIKQIMDQLE